KIKMNGKKLKGEFALVKLKNAENNAWLLIKHRDKYAKETDITKKDKSVVSGKTLEKVEATTKNFWGKKKKTSFSPVKKNSRPKQKATSKKVKIKKGEGKKAPFPKTFSP